MAIRTQESFSGFIASEPQLSQTSRGEARFYSRVGQEHDRKESDGSFTELETTFHDLVAYRATAERALPAILERLGAPEKKQKEGMIQLARAAYWLAKVRTKKPKLYVFPARGKKCQIKP